MAKKESPDKLRGQIFLPPVSAREHLQVRTTPPERRGREWTGEQGTRKV